MLKELGQNNYNGFYVCLDIKLWAHVDHTPLKMIKIILIGVGHGQIIIILDNTSCQVCAAMIDIAGKKALQWPSYIHVAWYQDISANCCYF